MHRINRMAFCNKCGWGTEGVIMYRYGPKFVWVSLYLLSYKWKNESVTTKSFNSNSNTNAPSDVVHGNNRMEFCNKWVWGTPGGNKFQDMLKL